MEIRPRDIVKASLKSNHARIDARELPNLLPQIEVYQGTHVTRLALKLMALSFVRTSELIGAKWTEFDLEAARWNIPADRMKMRSPIVPLASQSFEVLDTHASTIRKCSSPTEKKYVLKVLLNFVLTSRAS
jgi:integrase